MGIDKSMHEDSPIVVVEGTVYQYGKSPEYIPWSDQKWDPPQWIVEHHSYAKDHYCFDTEQDMLDFIDALPESARRNKSFEGKPWNQLSREERDRAREQAWREVRSLAAQRREARANAPAQPPEERFTREARADIDAVLNAHLTKPWEWWNDPDIERQVRLNLKHHLAKYREAIGWTKEEITKGEKDEDEIPF